jgi:hypothetical protein
LEGNCKQQNEARQQRCLASFVSEELLTAGGDLANVFRKESHDLGTAGFVLDAVDTGEDTGAGFCAAHLSGQACNGIEANSGKGFPFVGERDFKAIREARKSDNEVRMCFGQVLERLIARSEDGRLPLSDRIAFEAGGIGEVARRATDRRGQTRIGVE